MIICQHLVFPFSYLEKQTFVPITAHNNETWFTPNPKYLAAIHQSHKHTSFSLSIFSGSIDTAGSVTHHVLWAFTQLFVNEFSVCDLFSPHSAGVSLALVLEPISWSMEINLMCFDCFCTCLSFQAETVHQTWQKMLSPNYCVQNLLIMREACTQ